MPPPRRSLTRERRSTPEDRRADSWSACVRIQTGIIQRLLISAAVQSAGDVGLAKQHQVAQRKTPQRYEALRGLSEQARYLSPAGINVFTPLKVPRDVDQARVCFESIRSKLEAILMKDKKTIPCKIGKQSPKS